MSQGDSRPPRDAETVRVGTLRAVSGRVRHGRVWVTGFVPDLMPPLALVGGTAPGPVLAVIAGLSGTETASVEAARTLAARLRPDDLAGTLVIVPVADVPAFRDRRARVSPLDGRRLDASFPGAPRGGPTTRLAHALDKTVLSAADAVLVLRSGSVASTSAAVATVAVEDGDDAGGAAQAASLVLARALGLPMVVEAEPAGSVVWAARRRGAAAAAAEAGDAGRAAPAAVRRLREAALAALGHLRMAALPAAPTAAPGFFQGRAVAAAPADGYWRPQVRLGMAITRGDRLGLVQPLQADMAPVPVVAPADGVVVALDRGLAASSGQALAAIALPDLPIDDRPVAP